MNKDRVIGIVTITAVLLLLLYIAFAMWQNERKKNNTLYVQFPEMGALQNEDIVTIRGFAIGHIASIVRANEKALVEIDLYEPRSFRTDTKFKNISPNIMGSRNIAVEPGAKGEFARPGHVFDGEFELGLAEILYLTSVVNEQVSVMMEFIRLLRTGDENNPPLHRKFESAIAEIEGLLAALSKAVSVVEKQTITALSKVDNYTWQISEASVKINKSLDTIRVQAQDGVIAADKIISEVSNSIAKLSEILIQFESSPITVALLDKKEVLNDIDSLRSALQAFVSSIDRGGVKIYDESGKRKSMVTFKNIHLFRETARSKAKKRSEAEKRSKAK